MSPADSREYYLSRKSQILGEFDSNAKGWRPFLVARYGDEMTDSVLREASEQMEVIIPRVPDDWLGVR